MHLAAKKPRSQVQLCGSGFFMQCYPGARNLGVHKSSWGQHAKKSGAKKSGPKKPCLKSGLGLHRQTKILVLAGVLVCSSGLSTQKTTEFMFVCGFPCILQGLILDAPGCKEAKVSSATVWLWFLYAVLSWCQEPGCAQVILGATCQEKWSQKKWPKKALFEIRPGASQANKKWADFLLYRWEFRSINIR